MINYTQHKINNLLILSDFALSKGGALLSDAYYDNKTPLLFSCKDGHNFYLSWQHIFKDGRWCRICNGKRSIYSIEDLKLIAENKGGKCLSNEYKDQYSKLKFQCKLNHQWETAGKIILNGSWCPICSTFLYSEEICRLYFETIFNTSFIKIRPEWLKNSQENRLELDGYCSELNLAFEHQGRQHFENSVFFHKKRSLEQTIISDNEKKILCNNLGIILICIPEINYYLDLSDLKEFIKNQLLINDIAIPSNYHQLNFDISKIYSANFNSQTLLLIKNKSSKLKITCLSLEFIAWKVKLQFKCEKCNYEWEALPYNIINEITGCPKCNKKFWEIEDIKNYALTKIGDCLSTEYKNQYSILHFKCRKNHEWSCSFDNILNHGLWCPQCPINLEEISIEAEARGGKCLSNKYINLNNPIEWACKNKHVFLQPYKKVRIRKFNWCTLCPIIKS